MTIAILIAASILIGWFAYSVKHRQGMLWGMLTFFLGLPWLLYMGLGSQVPGAEGSLTGVADIATAVLPPAVVMLVVLALLPASKTSPAP